MPNSNIPTDIPIKSFTLDGVEIPLAGGGQSETCTLTLTNAKYSGSGYTVIDSNGNVYQNSKTDTTLTVNKNVLIYVSGNGEGEVVPSAGGLTQLVRILGDSLSYNSGYIYQITNDATLYWGFAP